MLASAAQKRQEDLALQHQLYLQQLKKTKETQKNIEKSLGNDQQLLIAQEAMQYKIQNITGTSSKAYEGL